jgi:hypothetical protein
MQMIYMHTIHSMAAHLIILKMGLFMIAPRGTFQEIKSLNIHQ